MLKRRISLCQNTHLVTTRYIVSLLVRFTFLFVLFYFCLQFFIPRWESLQLSDRLSTLSVSWIIAAALFTSAYYALGAVTWALLLRQFGVRVDRYILSRAYVFSLLAKYIPVIVVAHGVRTRVAVKSGVPVLVCMKSFLLETMFALGTASAISIPGTIYYFPAILNPGFTVLAAVFILGLIVIVATIRFKLFGDLRFTVWHSKFTGNINILLLYMIVWLVSGVAHWCLANALGDYESSHLPELIIAVSASWALGFVSIFAPAGLGIREAVLYFFVNTWMDQSDVILFVTLSRLLMFGVEILLTLGFVLYSKLVTRPEATLTK